MRDDKPPIIDKLPDFGQPELKGDLAPKPPEGDPHGIGAKASAMGRHIAPAPPILAPGQSAPIEHSSVQLALPETISNRLTNRVTLSLGGTPVEVKFEDFDYPRRAQKDPMEGARIRIDDPNNPPSIISVVIGDKELLIDISGEAKWLRPPLSLEQRGITPEVFQAMFKELQHSREHTNQLHSIRLELEAEAQRKAQKHEQEKAGVEKLDNEPFTIHLGRVSGKGIAVEVDSPNPGSAKVLGVLKRDASGPSILEELPKDTNGACLQPANPEDLPFVSSDHLTLVIDKERGTVTVQDTSTNGSTVTNKMLD